MQSFFSKIITIASLICIFITGWYLFVSPGQLKTILFPPAPCTQPIRYSIGELDPRFNLSTSTAIQKIEQASNLWSATTKKNLFVYDPNGSLKVNFIYDKRQSATDKLQQLGYKISNDQASYDSLKLKLTGLKNELASKKSTVDALTKKFNINSDAYEAEVKQWNEKGGATQEIVNRLNAEQSKLKTESEKIKKLVDDYNAFTEQVNSVVAVVNRIADSLNIKVDQANEVTGGIEKEFEEGEYVVDQQGTRINIYEFDSEERLLRVLAHEFGHALDLDHVEDPKAIMYYLNKDKTVSLSETDIQAITTLCTEK